MRLVALPGEPFAAAAVSVRDALETDQVTFVVGYEVCEAYRFYGLPGAFAAGSLERLVDRATGLARSV